jgi:hypothetical protein
LELLRPVDQAEVVAAFLHGEVDSERFAPQLRRALRAIATDEALVRDADLGNADENALRHRLLFAYRGNYLGAWFDELSWSLVALEPDEVLAIRYIDWDYWLEITGGTRLPADGAAYERSRGADDRYETGAAPLICARADRRSHLVVIEGHGRLTALAMHPESIPSPLEVLLGEGVGIRRWSCY